MDDVPATARPMLRELARAALTASDGDPARATDELLLRLDAIPHLAGALTRPSLRAILLDLVRACGAEQPRPTDAMRRVESAAEWAALLAGGRGCIYNDYASAAGLPGNRGNTLHAAGCPNLRSPWRPASAYFTSAPKYFAAECAVAVAWLDRERGREGAGWRRCGRCLKAGPLPAGGR